jgi:hypothetical protein
MGTNGTSCSLDISERMVEEVGGGLAGWRDIVGRDGNGGRSCDAFNGARTGERQRAASRPLGVRGVIGRTVVMVVVFGY